jgi:hypothetical protein
MSCLAVGPRKTSPWSGVQDAPSSYEMAVLRMDVAMPSSASGSSAGRSWA